MSVADDTSQQRVGGRPLTTLTEAQRAEVETLAAVLTAAQIADFLGIGRTTFFAILNRDADLSERYKRGKARAIGAVAQSLVTKARAGNVTAMIFFLKTQGGWRETVEVTAPIPLADPMIDLTQLSDQALEEIVALSDRMRDAQTIEMEQAGRNGHWTLT